MIKINLDECCHACAKADLDCRCDEFYTHGVRNPELRNYYIYCRKEDVCKIRKSDGSEIDHEWWK